MWAPELIDLMNPDSNQSAAAMIEEVGAEKIILARCDSQASMAWGLKSGIRIYQGYLLDSLAVSWHVAARNVAAVERKGRMIR